ncbi:chorismate--pyruvate lyase [Butyricicoccus sp.]|uniref:chorismate--pyruvate lyase n=1 Tax=Butyricicoccus sp. TaxID=2049021 RepID=UPI0037358606
MGYADPVNYTVVTIDGDYAMLRNESEPDAPLAQVALALLPDGISDGSRVQRILLEYTLL